MDGLSVRVPEDLGEAQESRSESSGVTTGPFKRKPPVQGPFVNHHHPNSEDLLSDAGSLPPRVGDGQVEGGPTKPDAQVVNQAPEPGQEPLVLFRLQLLPGSCQVPSRSAWSSWASLDGSDQLGNAVQGAGLRGLPPGRLGPSLPRAPGSWGSSA